MRRLGYSRPNFTMFFVIAICLVIAFGVGSCIWTQNCVETARSEGMTTTEATEACSEDTQGEQ